MSDGAGQLEREEGEALADLYRRYAAWLLGRLRHRFGDEAEDLVQEAYMRIAAYPRAGVCHPKALLMRIAANVATDRARARTIRARHAATVAASPQRGQEPPTQVDSIMLEQMIVGLPEPLRDVFVLSRFRGLTTAQISERLGISPKTAEWRLTKALARCAAQLKR